MAKVKCCECMNLWVGTVNPHFCQGVKPITKEHQCAGYHYGKPRNAKEAIPYIWKGTDKEEYPMAI